MCIDYVKYTDYDFNICECEDLTGQQFYQVTYYDLYDKVQCVTNFKELDQVFKFILNYLKGAKT